MPTTTTTTTTTTPPCCACSVAKYGESLRMNQNGIGHHGIVNYHTGSTLNVRMQGNVISNKTEPYDPKNSEITTGDITGTKHKTIHTGHARDKTVPS